MADEGPAETGAEEKGGLATDAVPDADVAGVLTKRPHHRQGAGASQPGEAKALTEIRRDIKPTRVICPTAEV